MFGCRKCNWDICEDCEGKLRAVTNQDPNFMSVVYANQGCADYFQHAKQKDAELRRRIGLTQTDAVINVNYQVADSPHLDAAHLVKGDTALIAAARNGHIKVVEILMTFKGIDTSLQNAEGVDALDMAVCAGRDDIADIILLLPEVLFYKLLNFQTRICKQYLN